MVATKHEAISYRKPTSGTVYQSQQKKNFDLPGEDANTLPKAFLKQVRKYGNQVAERKKRYGIWIEYTWDDVYEHVSNFYHGLVSMGLEAGDTVCIIGDNDPEMYWTQIAVHCCSAKTNCIFSDALPDPDLVYAITQTGAKFLVAHDQEQVDKALEIRDKIPAIKKVIYWEDRGMWGYDDEWLASFEAIEAVGKEHKTQNPDSFEKSIAATQPEDVVVLSMTSGTTGLPKFAMLTNQQFVYGFNMNFDYIPVQQSDNWLSFSPMAWATEQAFGFSPHVQAGMMVNFQEGPETFITDLREIAPVGLLFPSRFWENLASTVRFRVNDSLWINRKLFDWFMPIAYQITDLKDDGKAIPSHLKFLRWLGEFAVFEPLRDKLGLTNARNVLTAGAMLSPDVVRFFRALGVELRQLYASTETFATIHRLGKVQLDTVGEIVPGVEIKITEDQEILVRTEARFAGYYNQPDKTGEAIDEEGWYYTGDAGYMRDDGHLVYLERVKDMIELSGGHRFSPQFIEGRLKFSPYIQDVMTIGGFDMAYVAAIIIINFETVSRWAEKRGITFTTFVDLSQKTEIYDLVTQDIMRVNESLPSESHLKKFVILHKEFDADEGELTRTRKLKRHTLYQKYSDIVEALYGERSTIMVRAEVTYRDGRSGMVETELHVHSVE
ncbi:MAG: AMP-binding protein [Anaerolineae bacterium]|nr:AMP-binding protein [Anaerolineae bacterium]MDQ7036745.1 AMP-binding protein [Anaerolineae bacterium]